ncbi:hypothetical protein HDU76_008119, partial [Blyttiomyces sp. JEL0837]
MHLSIATSLVSSAIIALMPSSLVSAQGPIFTGSNCYKMLDFTKGQPSGADFVLQNGKVSYTNDGLVMTLQPPINGNNFGVNALATTTHSVYYGTVEARVKHAPTGGVITAFTMIGQDKDEIDWEWVGDERNQAWTNFFYKGRRERDPATTFEIWSAHVPTPSDGVDNFHNYKIEWTPYSIVWSINGQVAHEQKKPPTWELANTGDGTSFDHYHYPVTPLTIQLGIWNYQGPEWGHGPIDWTQPSAQNGFSTT